VAFSDVTGLFFLVLRVALALFACRTAMKFSYFREITALIHTFSPTTANNFSYFREITAPSHNFSLPPLPTTQRFQKLGGSPNKQETASTSVNSKIHF